MMMAQNFPGQVGMQPGHPGLPHGHPMAGGQHPAHMGGHPNMMQGMHPVVSGPQVTQGPMVTGMPPGPGTPAPGGPMQNAHAMAHLGPAQQQMFQQQPQMGNFGINPQTVQHQQMLARQRQQMFQMNGQMPVNIPNGQQGISQAQMQQMRAAQAHAQANGGMTMPMQQQIQLMQQNAQQQHHPQMQQAQAHALAQQAQAQQAQIARQQQQQQVVAQQMQLSQSQEPHTQPPQSQPTPAPQNPPQPQQNPSGQQPPQQGQQGQQQGQNSNQQQQQQGQALQQQQQREQQMVQQEAQLNQQKASSMNMQQRMQQKPMVGVSILRLVQYQDHLGNPNRPNSLEFWEDFVRTFFSTEGVLLQQLYNTSDGSDKKFRVGFPSLPRFYHAHFNGGIKQIWMSVLGANEHALPTGGHTVSSKYASTKYVYENDNSIVTMGEVHVNFDQENKIELLDIQTKNWTEYIPRLALQPSELPDQKVSPKLNKNMNRKQQKSQPPPPGITIPGTKANAHGIPLALMQFLEMAEVFSAMTPLIQYSQHNQNLTPREAFEKMVSDNAARNAHVAAMAGNGGSPMQNMNVQRPPGMVGPNQFASPALQHLGLPNQGSPHLSGPNHTPSPAQNHAGGPVAMAHQQSQQGSNLSGSQINSANTSPNVTNKRRRPSAVKQEDDGGGEANGTGAKAVKPSPKIGGKRQKAMA